MKMRAENPFRKRAKLNDGTGANRRMGTKLGRVVVPRRGTDGHGISREGDLIEVDRPEGIGFPVICGRWRPEWRP